MPHILTGAGSFEELLAQKEQDAMAIKQDRINKGNQQQQGFQSIKGGRRGLSPDAVNTIHNYLGVAPRTITKVEITNPIELGMASMDIINGPREWATEQWRNEKIRDLRSMNQGTIPFDF